MFLDRSQSTRPVEFVRWNGGENKILVGNRVQLEDSSGNLLNLVTGLSTSSPDLAPLLTQIQTLLAGTLSVSTLQPNVFKTVDAVSIASDATIWTPASGKKFRLMGALLSVIGAVGNVTLKDGSTGIFMLPNVTLAAPLLLDLGDGILSTAVNNVLKAGGAALQVLNGTVWGIES